MAAYVVNKHGAVHSVSDDQVETLLRQGLRLASPQEIEQWLTAQGLTDDTQNHHADADPVGKEINRGRGRSKRNV